MRRDTRGIGGSARTSWGDARRRRNRRGERNARRRREETSALALSGRSAVAPGFRASSNKVKTRLKEVTATVLRLLGHGVLAPVVPLQCRLAIADP